MPPKLGRSGDLRLRRDGDFQATRMRDRRLLALPVLLLCFGLLGLMWLLRSGRWRAPKQVRQARQRMWSACLAGFALLLSVGVASRAYTAANPPELCHSRISVTGAVDAEPLLPAATAGSPVWNSIRRVVVAPVSGLALLGSRIAGQHHCSGPPFNVTFSWPPSVSGGSAVGDTFVTWIPSDGPGRQLPGRISGTGLPSEQSFVRFGPNMSTDRVTEQRLAEHETRHLDQWAVFSIVGGPLAFPLTYWADSLLFPSSRNHFERDAGLDQGGYPEPADHGPAPLWKPLVGLAFMALALLRRRLPPIAAALVGEVGRHRRRRRDPVAPLSLRVTSHP